MGSYKTFTDFVASLSQFDERTALTIRPFLKIERLSYAQLQVRIYQAAHYLVSEGLRSGQRIMIVGANSPEWVSVFLGAQLLGVTVVPVDARSNLEIAQKYAHETTPKLIFRGRHNLPELDQGYATRHLDDLDTLIADQPAAPPKEQLKGDETALIVFTSGTTAEPKGVVLTQANILSNVSGVQRALDIDPDWRLLSVLPLSHMYELTGGCLAPLSKGASIFYVPRVTPLAIARGLHDYHITTLLAVPQLLSLFLQRIRQTAEAQGKSAAFEFAIKCAGALPHPARRILFRSIHEHLGGHLSMVVTGGAPIPHDVAVTWERMGVKMVQGYGLTETSPVLALNNPPRRRLDYQGKLLDNVKVRIAKGNREIQATGPSVFSGYWRNTAATRAAFTDDGWFKTGDIGSLTDGWLQIQGRDKFTIVLSSGLKVFPEDIEVVTDKRPEFKSVCIVGVKNSDGEQVHAVVISDKPDAAIDKSIAAINGDLEPYQHITNWIRWPEAGFPRTRLLKIDCKKIQIWANEPGAKLPAADNTGATMGDPIVTIIRLSLDKPTVAVKDKDRLADLGLDSLRRLTVVSLIEEQLGVAVAESQISARTTVAELRKLIVHGGQAEPVARRPRWPFWLWVRLFGNGLRETLLRGILGLWVRQRTEGLEHLEGPIGPAIYIFNHVDSFDGAVVYRALPWRVRNHLAAATADDFIEEHKAVGNFCRFAYVSFNFARHEPYLPSLEYLAELVDKGWNIALSPEGTISPDGKLLPFKSGIGLLAVELGLPVVCVKTIGLYGTVPLHAKWPKKRSHVTVRIGSPERFGKTTSYDQATQVLRKRMGEL